MQDKRAMCARGVCVFTVKARPQNEHSWWCVFCEACAHLVRFACEVEVECDGKVNICACAHPRSCGTMQKVQIRQNDSKSGGIKDP